MQTKTHLTLNDHLTDDVRAEVREGRPGHLEFVRISLGGETEYASSAQVDISYRAAVLLQERLAEALSGFDLDTRGYQSP